MFERQAALPPRVVWALAGAVAAVFCALGLTTPWHVL